MGAACSRAEPMDSVDKLSPRQMIRLAALVASVPSVVEAVRAGRIEFASDAYKLPNTILQRLVTKLVEQRLLVVGLGRRAETRRRAAGQGNAKARAETLDAIQHNNEILTTCLEDLIELARRTAQIERPASAWVTATAEEALKQAAALELLVAMTDGLVTQLPPST
jgi:hypothetical protein